MTDTGNRQHTNHHHYNMQQSDNNNSTVNREQCLNKNTNNVIVNNVSASSADAQKQRVLGERNKLLHQMSSGFGTQQSRDDPTITESLEMRTINPMGTSQDTERGFTPDIQQYDEAYLQYQKSLVNRSPSYRKSIDDISVSDISSSARNSLIKSPPLAYRDTLSHALPTRSGSGYNKSPAPSHRSIRSNHSNQLNRIPSDQSLNTFSIEQDLSNQMNLKDELLSCDQKELFQFLSDDFDNSTNYFSDTVGFGSAMIDPDTDSLILNSKKDDLSFASSTQRKFSNASIRSNISNISNSVFQALERKRGGSWTGSDRGNNGGGNESKRSSGLFGSGNSGNDEHEPLVNPSEFDEIIHDFETELKSIHSISIENSLAARTPDVESRFFRMPHDDTVVFRKKKTSTGSTASQRSEMAAKRRSLEKQNKVSDEEFDVKLESKRSLDHLSPPPSSDYINISPSLRRKTNFQNSFDRIKRLSLIERVEEAINEQDTDRQIVRVESERLPRKYLSKDKLETLSLKSSKSQEDMTTPDDNLWVPSKRGSKMASRADIKEFQRNMPTDVKNTVMKKVTLKDYVDSSDTDSKQTPSKKKGKQKSLIHKSKDHARQHLKMFEIEFKSFHFR